MKNPWLAWYPGDYINKTRHLSMAQHGAYMLLLWEYYINGPILANASGLLNICCGRTEADQVDVNYVLERFFTLRDGFWHHERADEELQKRLSIRKQLQLNGKKGGIAKASNGLANATVLLEQKPSPPLACSQSQSHKTITPAERPKVTPEGLHPMQYATHICDELVIPSKGNQETVSGTIETLAKSMKSSHREAHDYLLAKALAAKEAGETVNLFWFRDGKYNITRNPDGQNGSSRRNPEPRRNTQAERAFNNIAAVAAVVGGSNRVVAPERSAGVEHRRLTDGTGQKT